MASERSRAGEGLPAVAIVGRTNAGKSTLFNRIVGGGRALVDGRPGVTRDRLSATADWTGRRFVVTDTGGFEADPSEGLGGRVREQSLRAVTEADVVIYVVDGRAGVAPADVEAARLLSRTHPAVVLAVNKIDSAKQEVLPYEFYRLGLGDPIAISAEHAHGVDDLLDRVLELLPERTTPGEATALGLAFLGRPNVGKSSLLNRILGEERVLVDESPGTTRDAIDTRLVVGEEVFVLVDTAGIRRKSKVGEDLERATIARALRAVERADVALLVIDATEGVTDQDARLARIAWDRGRGLLLVANKWDLLPPGARDPRAFASRVRERYAHLAHVPVVSVSALHETHVDDILPAARRVSAAHRTRISTRELNDIVAGAGAAVEPPIVNGKRARFYYATTIGAAPPTIALFVNDPKHVSTAYLRYLENRIRDAVPLAGTPLRIRLRARPRDRRRRPPERTRRSVRSR